MTRLPIRHAGAAILLAAAFAPAASAQETAPEAGSPDYLAALKACQSQTDDTARLACYDQAVGAVVAASDQGEVRVVDREEVEQTRRRLFGFSLPKIALFGGDDGKEEMDTLVTTITKVRKIRSDAWIFETEEGASWQIVNAPMRLIGPREGQSVEFKKAAMGSYFIRINGQMGVKGRRIN